MKRDIKKEKLIDKARPYARLWNEISKNCPVLTKDRKQGQYSLVTVAIGDDFYNLFDYLRFGRANFIFVDGIGENNVRLRGLFCIDEERQLATSEECFFIGESYINNAPGEQVLLTARQMESFIGENAQFLVCKIAILEKEKALNFSIKSFLDVLEGYVV